MVDLELQKIDLDVEGHIRLQCGTEQHIKPRFNLILPSNIDLENDLKRLNEWEYAEMLRRREQGNPTRKDRPIVELTGIRIVAFIYANDIEGRERAGVTDDRRRSAMRAVTLYEQQANNGRLD